MESQDFKTLAAEIKTATTAWTATMKTAICKVAELESKNTKKEIVDLFLTTFKRVAHLVLLQEDPNTDLDPVVFAAFILDHNHARLLQHIGITRNATMTSIFAPVPYDEDVFTREFAQTISPFAQNLSSLMTTIFIDSWNTQLTAYKRQAGECAVSKQVRKYLNGTATVQAAKLMDAKPTANRALLKDVIKKQVDQETHQLHAQLNWLQQAQSCSLKKGSNQPSPPKKTRGAKKDKRARQQRKTDAPLASHPHPATKTAAEIWTSCPPPLCHPEEESRKPKTQATLPNRMERSHSTQTSSTRKSKAFLCETLWLFLQLVACTKT